MEVFQQFNNASIPTIVSYVRTFGIMAPLVVFVLFVIQAAVPVFPYIVLAAAGGLLFGFKLGFLLSWVGALTGACIAYGMCHFFAGDWARTRIQRRWGYDIKAINNEAAFWSIIVARIIPVVPTPLINVAAAVGGVPFWNFFFSSAIGKIPSALLYTGLGVCLFRAGNIKLTLFILAGIIALVMAGRYLKRNRLHLSG